MDSKSLFSKFYSRLAREGFFKALICGLMVGFGANFVVAFITWFTPFNGLWLAIGVGIGVTAIMVPVFYYKKFRPTTEMVARRVDRLGLEERLITMVELENDESYIAMRQREDAKAQLNAIKDEKVKLHIPAAMIAVCACLLVVGISMTTVTGLSANGYLPDGNAVIDNFKPTEYVEVTYLVEEGGYIEGEADQLVEKGGSATTVLAVADDGWAFESWSDGLTDPSRTDVSIKGALEVTANFVQVEEGEEGDGGDGQEGEESSESENSASSDSDSSSESESSSGSDPSSEEQEGTPANGSNGSWEPNDTIIDGETDYHSELGDAQSAAMGEVTSGDMGGEGDVVGNYFDNIG